MLDVSLIPFPELQTERTLLRRVTPADAEDLFRLRSDKQVMQYVDRDPWQTIDESIEMIRNIEDNVQKGEGISWAVCLKDDPAMIGMAGLWRIMKEHHRAEIGYTLMPQFWNRGLMSEVLQSVVDYGFYELKLHSIEANINPGNLASKRLIEKMGFVQEAYFRENYYFNGKFLDSVIYSRITPLKEEMV